MSLLSGGENEDTNVLASGLFTEPSGQSIPKVTQPKYYSHFSSVA